VGFVATNRQDTYPAIDPMQWDLSGKVVVIVGASRGIGKAMALSYARAGASRIVIAARSSKALVEVEAAMLEAVKDAKRKAPEVVKIELDVTSPKSVEEAAKSVKITFGRLDILVNNAGASDPWNFVHETEPGGWWNTWTVNVFGPYLCTRAFLPLLLDSEEGMKIIVNVSSIGALWSIRGASAYQTTKLALLRFTEFIDLEYKAKGVLAIALHPGSVKTDLGNTLPTEYREHLVDSPALPADFIVWLTKDRKDWLAGRYVSCNWDVTELEAKRDEIVEEDKLKVRLAV